MAPNAPSPAQIRSLYQSLLQTSSRFGSYNFKTYFTRRTREKFEPIIQSLESSNGGAGAAAAQVDLQQFFVDQSKELEVLKRAAEVNRMYEGPKLVVEHASPITGESFRRGGFRRDGWKSQVAV
jgi:hypothetical protein